MTGNEQTGETGRFTHLVVIGSSAGGIGALSEVVSNLPEDFPAPIVIAQHLDPGHKSHLKEILARNTKLPVRTVIDDGDSSPLEAGVVFVVPSNRHVNITDSVVNLTDGGDGGRPKPSVDLLLASAAEVYGEKLIAVILSGTGSDGTEGARAVKRDGGTVVIQDPETAEFGGMPGSLAPNTVDIVAHLPAIGPMLSDLISGVEVAEGGEAPDGEERELDRFLKDLREHHGLDFTSYKRPTISRRLQRRVVATGTRSIAEYRRHLHENPEEYRQLVSAFLIKVTEFFRDPELFAHLKEEVIPKLVEESREDSHQIRIWSAGCATGEEAYSLAILLSEILDGDEELVDVRIFATDVDEGAVKFARQGLYPASALSGLSEEQIERCFDRQGGQYLVKKQIRAMIVFGEHDLARRSPFPHLDLVVSRNVLIYFTTELQRRALQLFAYSLRDGGRLVLGKAETTTPLPGFFTQHHREHKIYNRHGERFLMPPYVPVSPAPVPRMKSGAASGANLRASGDGRRELRRTRSTAESAALNQIPAGAVVVDRRYDIKAINATARRMLRIHGAAIGEDLLHLLRDVPYSDVRGAIDAAFRDGEEAHTSELSVEDVANDEFRHLQIACHPQRAEGQRGPAETVIIMINDITELVRARGETEAGLERAKAEFEEYKRESEAEATRSRTQNERLVEANRQLEEANRELAAINEELQMANEESLLSTEEAQAATEEAETLNEELQATNEELETLNEELQATIEELNTTNDDLHARGVELREYSRATEEEQSRLYAILDGLPYAVAVVDGSGENTLANVRYKETFGEDGFLPLDSSGTPIPDDSHPKQRAARGETFRMEVIATTIGGEKPPFAIHAYPLGEGQPEGGVMSIRTLRSASPESASPEGSEGDGEAEEPEK